jgi:hypothetical protein
VRAGENLPGNTGPWDTREVLMEGGCPGGHC